MRPLRTLWGMTVFSAGAAVSYNVFLRELCLSWGATPEEVSASLPGDALMGEAGSVATRAMTVAATPAEVWPWLTQLACARGRTSITDALRLLLAPGELDAEDAPTPIQSLTAGTVIPRTGAAALRVEQIEREKTLVLRPVDGSEVWSLSLVPEGTATRLRIRTRMARRPGTLLGRAFRPLLTEPLQLVTDLQLLHGVKQRAERFAGATRVAEAP